jgi:hypothetical protein
MTKQTGKNLKLRTLTIGKLSSTDLAKVAGAQPRNTENMSVCFYQCCLSDYCGGSSGC